jgi:hypothetical protein
VESVFTPELRNIGKNKPLCSVAVADDITPKVTHVLFESIGEEVVAKINGSSMWFVHNVSIKGILNEDGDERILNVDVMKSTECEVQTRMPDSIIRHEEEVSVNVRTHFENSKYLKAAKVPAEENVCISWFYQ